MAKIFLSYSNTDEELAKKIESRLQNKGHNFNIPVGTPPIGNRRSILQDALRKSEVVIPLLSKNGLKSNFVNSEIGAARAFEETQGMLLIPVVIGEFKIPKFVSDYHCFNLPTEDDTAIDDLVNQISSAITYHIDQAPRSPRIFISHRHKDEAIAEALVKLIEAAFYVEPEDIRCTSVHPYTFNAGERTSEKLRNEISSAEVVIGLLTPDTKESNYVIAELGAAWGCDIPTFPLLAKGATSEHVPEPLNERNSTMVYKKSDCKKLLDDIDRVTTLPKREGVAGRIDKDATSLSEIASVSSEKDNP